MGRLTQLIDQTINRIYLIKSLQLARQRSVVKHCPFYPANSVIMKLVIIFLAVCILQIRGMFLSDVVLTFVKQTQSEYADTDCAIYFI